MPAGPFAEMPITGISRRGLVLLAVLAVVFFLVFQRLSPQTLVKLSAVAFLACGVALISFALPKYGLLIGVFYIYAGGSFYFHCGFGDCWSGS